MFSQPKIPLIDGRGALWYPKATDLTALWDYTLAHQVTESYDYTAAIRTAARELYPDVFIVLGPGNTLGGATAQALIRDTVAAAGTTSRHSRRAQNEQKSLISMGADA